MIQEEKNKKNGIVPLFVRQKYMLVVKVRKRNKIGDVHDSWLTD